MGLCLVVGVLQDMQDDEEAVADFEEQFSEVNRLLRAKGLPEHHEPRTPAVDQHWSCDMIGYSGLHYLRRLAAHLWAENKLPPPGDHSAANDPLLTRYYVSMGQSTASGLGRLFGRGKPLGPRFDHLIRHSDAEGYYLPQPFDDVLYDHEGTGVAGGIIGSMPRLLAECEQLAQVLEFPLDLDPESEEVYEAVESQGEGKTTWERYGVESYSCLVLHHACRKSIDWGAAIVFC